MTPPIVHIREVRPTDGSSLGALVEATLDECLGMALPSQDLTGRVSSYRAPRPGRKWYVAESDGTLAGYAVVSTTVDDASPCGAVERLYVRHGRLTPQDSHGIAAALVAV